MTPSLHRYGDSLDKEQHYRIGFVNSEGAWRREFGPPGERPADSLRQFARRHRIVTGRLYLVPGPPNPWYKSWRPDPRTIFFRDDSLNVLFGGRPSQFANRPALTVNAPSFHVGPRRRD